MSPDTPPHSGLPLNVSDLLEGRIIESNRIELKSGWDEKIKAATLRTVCAFANDLLNLNGGYIVLGVEEEQGRAVSSPGGLKDPDRVQREIRQACERIQPSYQPFVIPVTFKEASLVVVWAPGGDTRPYQAPEDLNVKGSPLHYYIRQGPETIQAKGDRMRQLLELTAKVPFDDRRSLQATVQDISASLVRHFLYEVGSDLILHEPPLEDTQLYRQLNLLFRVNGHEVPRNVALMCFSNDPDRFFPGTQTEVVQFGNEGDLIEERIFRGPIQSQIQEVLRYLDSLGGAQLRKIRGQAEVEKTVPYPHEAMEESLVNAIYHRSYEYPPEPVKVYLYPDRMEIISYPGPVPGIEPQHFLPGAILPPVAARNRRIGEFLKELRLAEKRGTGVPKIQRRMRENGSPAARFDFDEGKNYFRVTLPVHPRYQLIHLSREAAHLWVTGEKRAALELLQRSFEGSAGLPELAPQLIEYAVSLGNQEIARQALDRFESAGGFSAQPFLTLAGHLLDQGQVNEAISILQRIPQITSVADTIHAAILRKRAKDFEGAHRLFAEAYSLDPNDPKLIHEFAQTKMRLAKSLRDDSDLPVKRRLNEQAVELLRRAIQLATDPVRKAWCLIDLAKTLDWLRVPKGEVEAAYQTAIGLLPAEPRFTELYEKWQERQGKRSPH
jgi:ATP-dependent DNA helicase RecG